MCPWMNSGWATLQLKMWGPEWNIILKWDHRFSFSYIILLRKPPWLSHLCCCPNTSPILSSCSWLFWTHKIIQLVLSHWINSVYYFTVKLRVLFLLLLNLSSLISMLIGSGCYHVFTELQKEQRQGKHACIHSTNLWKAWYMLGTGLGTNDTMKSKNMHSLLS